LRADAISYSRGVPIPENREKSKGTGAIGGISHPRVGAESQGSVGNIRHVRCVGPNAIDKEFVRMIGKLVGALLGKRIAGSNQGAKGALLGYGAAALAKRSVPTLAAVALGGWAFNRWRDKRRARASYPSDSAPSSPA
jgi:hypothetical protein